MEIGAKIKFINHRFYTAMQENGFKTVAELSRATGLQQVILGKYLNLKQAPVEKHIPILEKTLCITIDYLFPEDILQAIKDKVKTELYIYKDIPYIPHNGVKMLNGTEVILESYIRSA